MKLRQKIATWNRILESEVWLHADTYSKFKKTLHPDLAANNIATEAASQKSVQRRPAQSAPTKSAPAQVHFRGNLLPVQVYRYFSTHGCAVATSTRSIWDQLLLSSIVTSFNTDQPIEKFASDLFVELSAKTKSHITSDGYSFDKLQQEEIKEIGDIFTTKIAEITAKNGTESNSKYFVFLMGEHLHSLFDYLHTLKQSQLQIVQCKPLESYTANSETGGANLKQLRAQIIDLKQSIST